MVKYVALPSILCSCNDMHFATTSNSSIYVFSKLFIDWKFVHFLASKFILDAVSYWSVLTAE